MRLNGSADLKWHLPTFGFNPQLSLGNMAQGEDGVRLETGAVHIAKRQRPGFRRGGKLHLWADSSDVFTAGLHVFSQSDNASTHEGPTREHQVFRHSAHS